MVAQGRPRVPSIVPLLNPVVHRLLGRGVPLGPNALITVRGRRSGLPRTTGVAVIENHGRRWIVGTFGEVNWVRNLRAAGEVVLSAGGRRETVHAVELSQPEATAFFKDVLVPYIGDSAIKRWLLGLLGARDILADPAGAAALRPVFELR